MFFALTDSRHPLSSANMKICYYYLCTSWIISQAEKGYEIMTRPLISPESGLKPIGDKWMVNP
jgi:hypothetical protein